jgi:hypothetical protein
VTRGSWLILTIKKSNAPRQLLIILVASDGSKFRRVHHFEISIFYKFLGSRVESSSRPSSADPSLAVLNAASSLVPPRS